MKELIKDALCVIFAFAAMGVFTFGALLIG